MTEAPTSTAVKEMADGRWWDHGNHVEEVESLLHSQWRWWRIDRGEGGGSGRAAAAVTAMEG